LDEASCAYVLRSILLALSHLHRNNSIHRDIKAANVLLSAGALAVLSKLPVVPGSRVSSTSRGTWPCHFGLVQLVGSIDVTAALKST
jgi:serine/threonine-protein kinase 24/25/MST4